MKYIPFDSRDKLYKSHIGAICEGDTVTFRLLLHLDAKCTTAFIIITKENENEVYYPLEKGELYDDCFQWFSVTLPFSEGLYWYYFGFDSDFGFKKITRFKYGEGLISNDGSVWQLTVCEPNFKTPTGFSGGIIYQIFPDRFFCSGDNKASVPSDRFVKTNWSEQPEYRQNNGPCSLGNDYYGGDLLGIAEKLPYISSLGVTIIYLNPIFEAHSNHRYNTADYFKIDPSLGTLDDFKLLCEKAKSFGIKIILDGVFSHTGDDSVYFNKSKRYDQLGAHNSQQSPFYNWFNFNNWPDDYSAWWGVPSLPETNELNPDFNQFINGENGVLRYWLRQGASGFRLDVADELPDEFLDNIRSAVKAENENAIIIGEVWEDATNKISYSVRRRYLRGKQLDSVMNYPFADAIIKFVTGGDAFDLINSVMTICENYPRQSLNLLMNHIGTHDTARILTVLGGEVCGNRDRSWQAEKRMTEQQKTNGISLLMLAAAIQFTLPGIPSLYYGDEAGMEGYGDPFCRGTYPWGNENLSLVDFYKKLGTFRKECCCFDDGEFYPIFAGLGLLSYCREKGNQKVLITVNRWTEPDTVTLGEEWNNAKPIFGNKCVDGSLFVDAQSFSILHLGV